MISKRTEEVRKSDIDALVTDQVCERRILEYKAKLPGKSDADKREFLADVSSFANIDGGDLLYGVSDRRDSNGQPTGTPEAADGLAGINSGSEVLRIEQMIRNGVSPVIQNIETRVIEGFDDGPVIMVRIPQSATRPHRVSFKNLSRFYGRTSAGKFELDVTELRAAFPMATASDWCRDDDHHERFDRDVIVLPEVVVRDIDTHVMLTLRPVFDAAWQSAGLSRSYNYDDDGNWVGQRR